MSAYAKEIIELVESTELEGDVLLAEVQKIMDAYATSVIQEIVQKINSQCSTEIK